MKDNSSPSNPLMPYTQTYHTLLTHKHTAISCFLACWDQHNTKSSNRARKLRNLNLNERHRGRGSEADAHKKQWSWGWHSVVAGWQNQANTKQSEVTQQKISAVIHKRRQSRNSNEEKKVSFYFGAIKPQKEIEEEEEPDTNIEMKGLFRNVFL